MLVGMSAWVALGVTTTFVNEGAWRTLGLLPPTWLLTVLAGAGALAGVLPGMNTLPWSLSFLSLLAVAAWAPISPVAALHAWSDSAALLLFGFVAAASASALRAARRRACADHRMAAGIAATAAALWLAAMWLALAAHPITGDEPHYLVIAQSVLADGDFDLANNYAARDYRSYYPGVLEPRHVSLGPLGQEYSFHGPATAMLALPGFVVGGPAGARLSVVLLTAAGVGFFWAAARRLTGSAEAAWASCAAFVVSAPVSVHATMIYPDALAATATAIGLWTLVRAESGSAPRPLALVACGAVLGLLPWLHIRLGLVAFALGIAILICLWRVERRLPPLGWLLVPPLLSAVGVLACTWVMFDTLDPTATFRQKASGSLAAAPAGVLGLLFDQEYGLLPYGPAFGFAVIGLRRVWLTHATVAACSTVAVVGTLILGASYVWWGGQSGPARFLVPVLPMAALWLAAWWHTASAGLRTLACAAILMSACWTSLLVVADRGAYVVNNPDGAGSLFEWISQSINVAEALPSMFRAGATPASEAGIAVIWSVAAMLAVWVARVRSGVARSAPARWALAGILCASWLTLAAAAVWEWREVSPWTPDRAKLAAVRAAGRGWHEVGLTRPPLRLTPPGTLFSGLSIESPRSGRPPPASLHVPFVPAGRYRVESRAAESSAFPQNRTFALELGRDAWPITSWHAGKDEGPAFVLPVPIWAVRVTSPQPALDAWRVLLRPIEVRATAIDGFAWRATRYDDLIVFGMDLSSYPEQGGLWLAGDRRSTMVVVDRDGRSVPVRLELEAGRASVVVALEHGEWRTVVALAAGARTHIDVPSSVGGDATLLAADVEGGFTADDGRQLGAWLRVERQP
jgi:hypothetical protein